MKSIFEEEARTEITFRLLALKNNSTGRWGEMNVAQMLAHCNRQMDYYLGNFTLEKRGNFLLRFFKSYLYNNRPYKKNSPTHDAFVISNRHVFEQELIRLRRSLNEVNLRGEANAWPIHPTFGRLTGNQFGKSIYKHLDHHLKQFGC